MIVTIGEGTNPFWFLALVSLPGASLLGPLGKVLVSPQGNILGFMLLVAIANLLIYYAIGYLIDYFIDRRRARKLASS